MIRFAGQNINLIGAMIWIMPPTVFKLCFFPYIIFARYWQITCAIHIKLSGYVHAYRLLIKLLFTYFRQFQAT